MYYPGDPISDERLGVDYCSLDDKYPSLVPIGLYDPIHHVVGEDVF